jgi:thioredoxin reductase (NADPH)
VTLDDGRERRRPHAARRDRHADARTGRRRGLQPSPAPACTTARHCQEAAAYRGERVVIVGGANSAGQAAVMFSRYAAEVVVVVRAASLAERMSTYLVEQIAKAIDSIGC